ncbi:MAG: hypothetical protein IPK52_14850 [Chloroflexi bacterium]|nr:hypothetical protein [Chloroflexota bacterium]
MALSISIEHKLRTRERGEKWMLRKAFEGTLPENILWRKKQKFASGAGSDQIFKHIADEELSDSKYAAEASQILRRRILRALEGGTPLLPGLSRCVSCGRGPARRLQPEPLKNRKQK